ncbi:MAG: hypothetical protein AAF436_05565 [Myxococcota bacterium]
MDPVDEAWGGVEAEWESDEAHRRFVGVCVALDRLPEAGKRYREVRERDPARREAAAAQIDKLLALATQRLEDTRVTPAVSDHKRTIQWVAFAIMMGLMAVAWWMLRS